MVEELWNDIPGFEGEYQVSTYGRVRSLDRKVRCGHWLRPVKGRILKTTGHTAGYEAVKLNRKNQLIHRLVAITFIERSPGCTQVNHKDGNKLNNRLENLEWCNASYNIEHANRTGLVCKDKLKARPVWNKGLTKDTDERVKKGTHKNKIVISNVAEILHMYCTELYSISHITKVTPYKWDVVKRCLTENGVKIRSISEEKQLRDKGNKK